MHFDVGANAWIGLEGDQRDAVPAGGKPAHELLMVNMTAGAAINSSRE